jgi:hypothetical protein
MAKSKNYRPQQPHFRWRYNQRCVRCDDAVTDWGYRVSVGGNHFDSYILCKKCGGKSIDQSSSGWSLMTGNGSGYASLTKRERKEVFWAYGRGPEWRPLKNKDGVRYRRATNGRRHRPYRVEEGKGWS